MIIHYEKAARLTPIFLTLQGQTLEFRNSRFSLTLSFFMIVGSSAAPGVKLVWIYGIHIIIASSSYCFALPDTYHHRFLAIILLHEY